MYYPDLTCYRDGGPDHLSNVYPSVKNIGWLGKNEKYNIGDVQPELVRKLLDIMFLDVKNSEDKKKGTYNREKSVNVHLMHMRGSPYKCPLCNDGKEITYSAVGVTSYSGTNEMLAGLNEVCIPSLTTGEYYSFPTMLCHYIVAHKYKPPQEFLDALAAFDLDKPYDIDKEQEDLVCIEMPSNEVNSYVPSSRD
jgi:hypothetical protein